MNMTIMLEQFSNEELERELKRRKGARPKPLKDIDWGGVISYLEDEGIGKLINKNELSDDFEHFLFENVLEIVYGDNIWEWWNKQL